MRIRSLVTALIGVAVAATVFLPTGSAVASPASPAATPGTAQVCTAVYHPDDGGAVAGKPTTENLVSYSCVSAAAAHPDSCSPDICDTETMLKAWADRDYKGSELDLKQSGFSGVSDCDADGYRWSSLPSGWNDRISSIRGYHKCNYIRAYQDSNTSGHCQKYVADVTYVGDTMNDKISSLRTQSAAKNC